jgi:hypothetical protein
MQPFASTLIPPAIPPHPQAQRPSRMGLDDFTEAVTLIVSELVANSGAP